MNINQFLALPQPVQQGIVDSYWSEADSSESVGEPFSRKRCPLMVFLGAYFPGEVREIDFLRLYLEEEVDGVRSRSYLGESWLSEWQQRAVCFAPEGRITAKEALFILSNLDEPVRYGIPEYRALDSDQDEEEDDFYDDSGQDEEEDDTDA